MTKSFLWWNEFVHFINADWPNFFFLYKFMYGCNAICTNRLQTDTDGWTDGRTNPHPRLYFIFFIIFFNFYFGLTKFQMNCNNNRSKKKINIRKKQIGQKKKYIHYNFCVCVSLIMTSQTARSLLVDMLNYFSRYNQQFIYLVVYK